jgi:hypothetical protein
MANTVRAKMGLVMEGMISPNKRDVLDRKPCAVESGTYPA